MNRSLCVAVIGDYEPSFATHLATDDALRHAAAYLGVEVEVRWLATEPLESDLATLYVPQV